MLSGNVDLLQSPELLEQVLATLPVGVWIMDDQGRIVHGNPAGQQIWQGARYDYAHRVIEVGVAHLGIYVNLLDITVIGLNVLFSHNFLL